MAGDAYLVLIVLLPYLGGFVGSIAAAGPTIAVRSPFQAGFRDE
jgi:hypothetical protein